VRWQIQGVDLLSDQNRQYSHNLSHDTLLSANMIQVHRIYIGHRIDYRKDQKLKDEKQVRNNEIVSLKARLNKIERLLEK